MRTGPNFSKRMEGISGGGTGGSLSFLTLSLPDGPGPDLPNLDSLPRVCGQQHAPWGEGEVADALLDPYLVQFPVRSEVPDVEVVVETAWFR